LLWFPPVLRSTSTVRLEEKCWYSIAMDQHNS
jgi:hypothetical protein